MAAAVGGVFGIAMAIVGLAVGAIAKLLLPGPDPGGWLATIILGIAGSWVGGFLSGSLGTGGGPVVGLIGAVLGAILLLLVYRLIRRQAWAAPRPRHVPIRSRCCEFAYPVIRSQRQRTEGLRTFGRQDYDVSPSKGEAMYRTALRFPGSIVLRFMVLLAGLLLSAQAWSQYGDDRGQWQILSARYGTAQRNVDVTQTLKNLARQDTTFRITNKTFGTDPAPGVVKTLRIYARGPGGGTRTFEYFENDFVDGNVFVGWSGGDWGQGGWGGGWGSPDSDHVTDRGQWQILQARYGTADRNVDVTQRLRELARQDTRFEVDNRTMGGDPASGVVKTLRIYARGPGGAKRTFEYGENNFVDGAMFTGWSGGDWGQGGWDSGWGHDSGSAAPRGGVTIVSAQYGEGPDRIDVTSRMRSMVRNGRISIRVTNDTMGSDPAPGRPKILWVTYYVGGRGQQQTKVYENQQLALP